MQAGTAFITAINGGAFPQLNGKEQSVAQHQFVALDLGLGYDQVGRNESREQALESRGKIFDMLYSEFGIRPEVLTSPQQIQAYTQQLIEQVKAMRTIPRPKVK